MGEGEGEGMIYVYLGVGRRARRAVSNVALETCSYTGVVQN